MRLFVAPGPLIPPSGTSSALRRTPGTSTIRMRCPASGRLIVRQSRLTRSLAGLSGGCVAPRTVLRPRSQKGSRIANRTIQGASLYRSSHPTELGADLGTGEELSRDEPSEVPAAVQPEPSETDRAEATLRRRTHGGALPTPLGCDERHSPQTMSNELTASGPQLNLC